jgi:hypothetical protein
VSGFFSRIFGIGGTEEDDTKFYPAGELGTTNSGRRGSPGEGQPPQGSGFTVERATEVIDDLPPDVSKESALRIVRGTLTAAGVRVEDLESSTRARETKVDSEIELARGRQDELRKKTEEVVRSLEEKIKKAQEDRDAGVAEEEEKISRAREELERIGRVRAFFGFPEEGASTSGDSTGDETQVLEPLDRTQAMRRPGSFADAEEPTDER